MIGPIGQFNFHFTNKNSVCEHSAALFTAVTGETAILLLQKHHLAARNKFAFSFRPMRKSNDGHVLPRSALATSGRAIC